jgi:hypothetical protein
MSINQIIEELPKFTVEERQEIMRCIMDLDDPPLSPADEDLVANRLAAHHSNPSSSVPLHVMITRLEARRKA